MLNVINQLDRARFSPFLFLLREEGDFLSELPDDVRVVPLANSRIRYAVKELARSLSEHEIELVYSGHRWTNLATVLAARLAKPRPIAVVSEHTPVGLSLLEGRWPHLQVAAMRWLYPKAATVGVPVPALGEEIREILGRRELPYSVLLNPVLEDEIGPRMEEGAEVGWPSGPVIVSAGRLSPEKGFDVLLEAISKLPDRWLAEDGGVQLLILGDGAERAALERQSEELGISTRVHFLGHVANPFAYYRIAEMVVLASRRESFGNVLVEAMTCGTPVIGTNCWRGSSFVVDDGRAGLLVSPEDPVALAEAMNELLTNDVLTKRLVTAGREYAEGFRTSRTVPAYEELFDSLIGSSS